MRICKVEFQRLLGFKEVSLEIDPTLQLVAGPNNAGKSSLVRLLETFFSDPSAETILDLKPLNEYYADEGNRALSRITVHFADLTASETKFYAPIIRQRDSTFSITLRSTKTGTVSFEASKKPSTDEARRYYEETLSRFHFVKIPSIRVADGHVGESDSLERLLDTLEAVLVRKGNARSTALQRSFSDEMSSVENLVGEVLDQSAAAIKNDLPFQENEVKFKLPSARHALRGMLSAAVIESKGDIDVPVAERGTGFQSALVLGILRYIAKKESQSGGNTFFAIEEPEAFLHPQTQRAMAKIIRGIAEDAQVLVTTHSSVLVDSFNIDQIARLPLRRGGLVHDWIRDDLEPADVGRLTRYCSAANSELIFANAAIFVEGEGDHGVLEKILGKLCGGPGGHYAMGITVIEASGLGKIKHLVRLAELFGVRSYVLSDRDGLLKKNNNRVLLDVLSQRSNAPDTAALTSLRNESDKGSRNLKQALERQDELNRLLAPYDAFILASDLEGLFLDAFGLQRLVQVLGPEGEKAIDKGFAEKLLTESNGKDSLAAWLGSKGWNGDGNKSGKLAPHLPSIMIDRLYELQPTPRRVLKPLVSWLQQIVDDSSHAPV